MCNQDVIGSLTKNKASQSSVFTLPMTAFDMRTPTNIGRIQVRNSITHANDIRRPHPIIHSRVRATASCTIDHMEVGVESLKQRAQQVNVRQ